MGCGHLDAWRLCLAGEAGRQGLDSSGVAKTSSNAALYAALGGRVGWAWPFAERFAFVLGLEGAGNLTRNSANLSMHQVWKAPSLSATLTSGVEARFP